MAFRQFAMLLSLPLAVFAGAEDETCDDLSEHGLLKLHELLDGEGCNAERAVVAIRELWNASTSMHETLGVYVVFLFFSFLPSDLTNPASLIESQHIPRTITPIASHFILRFSTSHHSQGLMIIWPRWSLVRLVTPSGLRAAPRA